MFLPSGFHPDLFIPPARSCWKSAALGGEKVNKMKKKWGKKSDFFSFLIPSCSLLCSMDFSSKSWFFAPCWDSTRGFHAPALIGGGVIKAQMQSLDPGMFPVPSPKILGDFGPILCPICAHFGAVPNVGSAATHWGFFWGGKSALFWEKRDLFGGNSPFWGKICSFGVSF